MKNDRLVRPTITTRSLALEVVVVLWVSFGATAVRAVLSILARTSAPTPLADQQVTLVAPVVPDRPWLDMLFHLSGILIPLGSVALVVYLLHASGETLAGSLGVDRSQPLRDARRGVALAAIVGASGLLLYLGAVQLGISARLVSSSVNGWYEIPVLIGQAGQAALTEEIVVLGYLILRLQQIGWSARRAVLASAVLRGTYHLYQGFGGFVGNLAMGLLFGYLFVRWRRATPMVVAHFLIDLVAFVGFALLADSLDWLPTSQ